MSKLKTAGFNLPGMPRSKRQDYPVIEAQIASKHTPVPWKLAKQRDREYEGWVVVRDIPEARAVRLVAGLIHHEDDGHLIAAAPEMLEALKAVLDDLERYAQRSGPGPDSRLASCIAAIAKAEGRK